MEFLKKHYEKIILTVVLLGLAATAILLFLAIESKKNELDIQVAPPTKAKTVTSVNLEGYQQTVDKFKTAGGMDFSCPHHVVNPVIWKQTPDGRLVKIVTSDLPRLMDIRPLHLIISFERAGDTGYYFGIERQAAKRPQDRKKVQRYLSGGGKTDLFILKNVDGTPQNPAKFVLELADSKEEAVVTPVEPFKRVDGYEADMRYDVDNRSFNKLRVGDSLAFGGEQYKVVAITENEVTVQASSNQKQITIKKNAP